MASAPQKANTSYTNLIRRIIKTVLNLNYLILDPHLEIAPRFPIRMVGLQPKMTKVKAFTWLPVESVELPCSYLKLLHLHAH